MAGPSTEMIFERSLSKHIASLSHAVVHGHSVTESQRPVIASNRIALDTGAYATGHLTTLVIDPRAEAIKFAWTNAKDSELTAEYVDPNVMAVPDMLKDYTTHDGMRNDTCVLRLSP